MQAKSKPTRVQRRRTKGWRMPPNTIYVGRGSKWGNPFDFTDNKRLVDAYRDLLTPGGINTHIGVLPPSGIEGTIDVGLSNWFVRKPDGDKVLYVENLRDSVLALKGVNLACWCPLDRPCHADVLLEAANGSV